MKLLQFLRERAFFFKLQFSRRCGLNEPEKKKSSTFSKATVDFYLKDARPIWSLLSIFCFIKFKCKSIFLSDTWLPGCYLIENTNWLCTNYDSKYFPEGVEARIWCNTVWQLAVIPSLLLTSVLKMVCAIACFT